MKNFITVLKFELGNYFKSKSFLVGSIFMALVLLLGVLVPPFFMNSDSDKDAQASEKQADSDDRYAIFDETGDADISRLRELIPQFRFVTKKSEADVKKAVDDEDVKGGFVIRGEKSYTYVVRTKSMMDSNQSTFEEGFSNLYREQALGKAGIDSKVVSQIYATQMDSEIVGKDSENNYWSTYALVFIIYFLVIFYGQMIATSVTQEKSNRSIEILVTSVDSNSLIFGKVIAGAIGGLSQMLIILAPGLTAYSLTRDRWGHMLDFLLNIPGNVWATYIIFGLMGYLLYAFIYGMLGALVSKTEDIGKAVSPVLMIYMVSFMIAIFGMMSPDSTLMKVASFIPFTSYNTMFVRVVMGSVSLPEVLLSGVLLAATCVGAGILTAKVFRFGTLMYGNPIRLSTAIKKIRQK